MVLDSHRGLPGTDGHQDRGRHHGPLHGRRRRAEELRAGHGRVRGNPRPRGSLRCTSLCGADHGGGRARRRVLVLDA
jgi:hypothetical protein